MRLQATATRGWTRPDVGENHGEAREVVESFLSGRATEAWQATQLVEEISSHDTAKWGAGADNTHRA